MTANTHEYYLKKAIALAVDSVQRGGGPFGAVIVRDGKVVAEAWNQVTAQHDASAHAEVAAIRKAGAALGRHHLDDCVLYASCEPCPMCLATALWAHIPRIYFAAPHSEAARVGFADTHIAEQLYGQARPVALTEGLVSQLKVPDASMPFEAWLARVDRVEY
ncbi:MAG: tRNA-specific adenosine deaminase [Gammaproteobacteria bacterium]|nr:tRNA-specific adenosine deaminase [Gammaproteobacteria bacterium]MBJ54897.1 tRNA-specific adenosine deaminase [Gammaproteobacteria bacterium]HBN13658.1 tRNA-specific adenosine deaminase [Pseudohongiella sp.]|tara:strand:- start:753 stop:1238 length:486 start_codon:yes stop_codon:yes gene_type:complete